MNNSTFVPCGRIENLSAVIVQRFLTPAQGVGDKSVFGKPQTVTSMGQCSIHFAWEEQGAAGPQCFKVDLLVDGPAHAATR